MHIQKSSNQFSFNFECLREQNSEWSFDTEFTFKLQTAKDSLQSTHFWSYNRNQKQWGWVNLMGLNKLLEKFITDEKPITFEMNVRILKMVGCGKEKLKRFDESMKELSDVVLVVKDIKFYTLRMVRNVNNVIGDNKLSFQFLSIQSSYFKSLFLGNFEESQKSEVTLTGIDPEDFQNFLELIHGEPSVDGRMF